MAKLEIRESLKSFFLKWSVGSSPSVATMIDLYAQENTRIDNLCEDFDISEETLNRLVNVLRNTLHLYDFADWCGDVDKMIARQPNDMMFLVHAFLYDAKYSGLKLS